MDVFIHNIIAPYRTPLFDEIAKKRSIHILYVTKNDSNRRWSQESKFLDHPHSFLFGFSFFRLKLSPFLFFNLIRLRPTRIVCLDDDPNFLNFCLALIYCRIVNIPFVSWFGMYKRRGHWTDFLSWAFRRLLYRGVSKVWSYSAGSSKFLVAERLVSQQKIVEGLQGYPESLIDFGYETGVLERYENKRLVYIGEINERKGVHDVLLPAIDLLLKKNEDFKLEVDVVGSGCLLEDLKKEFAGRQQIEFHGYRHGRDKYRILSGAFFLILPSHDDPWGWVVNEASALGVPCAVSVLAMSKEMTPEMLRFVPKAESMVDMLEQLCNMSADEYQEACLTAKKMADKHSLKKTLASYELL